MEKMIRLLNEKNDFLERFKQINEAGIEYFGKGDFDNLEEFYVERENLLAIIGKIDELIETFELANLQPRHLSADERQELREALDYKNDLVTEILAQDLHILSFIDSAKSGIIKELTQVQTVRKAIGGYHRRPNLPKFEDEG